MNEMTPIIDAHHHIWRQADLPWLLGPTQPRIFGAYDEIKRDYLIDEYRADAEVNNVARSVYVQANWAPNWFADEAAWVQAVADETAWPHGIIAYADVTAQNAVQQYDKLSKISLIKGIRHQLHWHENPLYRFAKRPDLAEDSTVRANISRLADYGWSFDLQIFTDQMAGAAGLAQTCPNVTFILQHAGMLEDLTEAGKSRWRDGLKRLADQSNVMCKLSGLGTFLRRNDPDHIAMVIEEALVIFGAKRCLFGSNFPIEKIWTSYKEMITAYRIAAAHLSSEDQYALFHDTAERVYRL